MEPRHRSLTHRALFERSQGPHCDVCGERLGEDGEDASAGLYVWTRGDEVRYEEPPLCPDCARALGAAHMRRSEVEEDDEG